MLTLSEGPYTISIKDDPTYTPNSADNLNAYNQVYQLSDDGSASSRHGVFISNAAGAITSCVLTAAGGATGIHDQSALMIEEMCVVAVGPFIASLSLPKLDLKWAIEVDQATCFGVYKPAMHNCLISHGELEIVRLSPEGEIVWRAAGSDIFTNGFTLHEHTIEVVDFNDQKYLFDIETGREVVA